MKNQKLTYRFHDPTPPGVAVAYLLKVLMEVNAPKVEQAIREAMSAGEAEEKIEQESQEQDEAVYEPEEFEEEEESLSQGWEMSMTT